MVRGRRSDLDDPTRGIGLATEKERGMPDRAHARRADLLLDPRDEIRALMPVRAFEADFHQFAGIQ